LVSEFNKKAVNSVVSNLSPSQIEKAQTILNQHELAIFNVLPSFKDESFLGWVEGNLKNMPKKQK